MGFKKDAAPQVEGIVVKKRLGQHFLRDEAVLETMLQAVTLTPHDSVLEIGCGDGVLTRAILAHPCARLWVFEIDPEWVAYVRGQVVDERLTIFEENILSVPLEARCGAHAPWVLLANLPYQITFPILRMLQAQRSLFREGVIMVQDEVAHKLLKTEGRDYGSASLFFQHYFRWRSLVRIPPTAFYPAPKVYSRLLHFVPRHDQPEIPQEAAFWKFIGMCFAQPRRTISNNLRASPYAERIKEMGGTRWDALRAQQMKFEELLELWEQLRAK